MSVRQNEASVLGTVLSPDYREASNISALMLRDVGTSVISESVISVVYKVM